PRSRRGQDGAARPYCRRGGQSVALGCADPGRAVGVVEEVPDATAAGHLEQPLFEGPSFQRRAAERAPSAGSARRRADPVEGAAEIARGVSVVVGRVAAREPEVVLIADRWRGRALPTLGAHSSASPPGSGTEPRSPSGSRVSAACRAGSA